MLPSGRMQRNRGTEIAAATATVTYASLQLLRCVLLSMVQNNSGNFQPRSL